MTIRIVITDSNLGDGKLERATLGDGFDVSRHDATTEDDVLSVGAEAEGLLVQWAPITERVLAGLPRLRAIVRYGIGLDNIDLDAASRHGVTVSNVDDYCLAEVADHTVAAVYAHNRRLTLAGRSVARGNWTTAGLAAPFPPGEDPVGIAGFGRIGREVALRASVLGFPVHVWDPFVSDVGDGVTRHNTLTELAAAVHHLTLHMPATDKTRGLVGRDVLAALGPDGHLVNTARGALVDEEALLDALASETLGFATLDVLGSEPPTGTAASIAEHEHALVTPHIAYLSQESLPRLQQRAAEILRGLLATED